MEEYHTVGRKYQSAKRQGRIELLAAQDDPGFQDYDYWISVEIINENPAEETELGQEFARTLALNGIEAARPYSKEDWLFSKPIVRRIVYRKKQVSGAAGM